MRMHIYLYCVGLYTYYNTNLKINIVSSFMLEQCQSRKNGEEMKEKPRSTDTE